MAAWSLSGRPFFVFTAQPSKTPRGGRRPRRGRTCRRFYTLDLMRARVLLAVLFIVAGVLHFVITPMYVNIMPSYLPAPALLVQISGAAEILGGIGLLVPAAQPAAAWGLILLLIAVMPANINMAIHPGHWPGIPRWLLWARLPLQLPLIYWALQYTRRSS